MTGYKSWRIPHMAYFAAAWALLADSESFVVLPHKWILERTLGWLMRNHRLSKDYERLVRTSETFIEVAIIRLILKRLARGG